MAQADSFPQFSETLHSDNLSQEYDSEIDKNEPAVLLYTMDNTTQPLLKDKTKSIDGHHQRINSSAEGKTVHVKEPSAKISTDSTPIPSQASQKLAESDKLEDQINLQHLVELMRIFHEADENGSDGLDIDEFRAAFGQILGKGKNDHQMAILFMKIDTNCDGTVDWDEFCTYMLLEYQEKESMAGVKKPPFPYPLKKLQSPHKDTVSCITMLPNLNRGCTAAGVGGSSGNGQDNSEGKDGNILSISKDGTICFWKSNLTLHKTINIEVCKPKLLWITDAVVMPNIHKMLMAFTDDILAVYDISTPSFERVFSITALPYCVVTLDYWYDEKDYNHSVLVFGDSGGAVCIMEFFQATRCLFGATSSTKQECHRITFSELHHHKIDGMKTTYLPKVHDDWVNKVRYWHCMEGVLSCSCDSIASLVITDINGLKENAIFQVRKGITSFDYSRDWNIIATGGMDRDLRLWNPYVSTKPTGVLKGHNTAILHVAINHADGHILSFSKDMELRVWTIQDQLCLQTCHRFQQLESHISCAFYFHATTATLLVGHNHLGALEAYREDHQNNIDIVSHEKPLCAALYNANFNQVVSGCHGSVVSVWDADTGEKTIQFSQCHGNMEITAMAFDPTGRRLITGGRDGSIKLWNFNNGACLSVLENYYKAEITCFSFLKDKIVVGGWSRVLIEYRDTREPDDIIPKYWGKDVHKEDILCMTYQEPDILVTSSHDGDIILWDTETQHVISVLNATDIDYSRQQYRLYSKLCSKTRKKMENENSKNKRKVRGSAKSPCYHKTPVDSSQSLASQKPTNERSHKPKFGFDDNTAVEHVLFLTGREQDTSTATLVACGAGGIVQFWNIYGGGLLGEFNVFEFGSRAVSDIEEKELHSLHSVTTCKVNSISSILITGTSLGHIQVWNISNYCLSVSCDQRPIHELPPLQIGWKGHFSSIVSVDLAEDKELIVTASTDRCVSLWTINGRYIGTFGEKQPWKLSYPLNPTNLPRKVPPGLHQVASFNTLQTIAGPSPSKWRLARNLFLLLMKNHFYQPKDQRNSIVSVEYTIDDSYIDEILGETYKRKTRFRQPIKPVKIRASEHHPFSIYSALKCPELQEPIYTQPHVQCVEEETVMRQRGAQNNQDIVPLNKVLPKKPITEKMLLPHVNKVNISH